MKFNYLSDKLPPHGVSLIARHDFDEGYAIVLYDSGANCFYMPGNVMARGKTIDKESMTRIKWCEIVETT